MEKEKTEKYRRYPGKFKEEVVKWMLANHASALSAAKKFGIPNKRQPFNWMKTYKEKGFPGLYEETRGRGSKKGKGSGRPPSFKPKQEETLEQEVQRLRMENDYLKKLQALVRERKKREQ